jgi:hypothetical protein
MGIRVRKEFADSDMDGTVVDHVPATEADLSDGKLIVRYTKGKQEALDTQTLLDIMVVAPIKAGSADDDEDKATSTNNEGKKTNTNK